MKFSILITTLICTTAYKQDNDEEFDIIKLIDEKEFDIKEQIFENYAVASLEDSSLTEELNLPIGTQLTLDILATHFSKVSTVDYTEAATTLKGTFLLSIYRALTAIDHFKESAIKVMAFNGLIFDQYVREILHLSSKNLVVAKKMLLYDSLLQSFAPKHFRPSVMLIGNAPNKLKRSEKTIIENSQRRAAGIIFLFNQLLGKSVLGVEDAKTTTPADIVTVYDALLSSTTTITL